MTKYIVELSRYGAILKLFEEVNNTFIPIGRLPMETTDRQFAIDREITQALRYEIEKCPIFLDAEASRFLEISQDLAEVFRGLCKMLPRLGTLRDKLLFLEHTQFLTLLQDGFYNEISNRLSTFFLAKKLDQDQNGGV